MSPVLRGLADTAAILSGVGTMVCTVHAVEYLRANAVTDASGYILGGLGLLVLMCLLLALPDRPGSRGHYID